MSETINQRIALYRKIANLTQTQAAEKLGMKCSTYSQMERKGTISADKLIALADIFGITPDTLLYDSKPANNVSAETTVKENDDFDFTPKDRLINKTLRQPTNLFKTDPPRFIVTHKEENIIKILRNLPRPDYEEIIEVINEKYHSAKSK